MYHHAGLTPEPLTKARYCLATEIPSLPVAFATMNSTTDYLQAQAPDKLNNGSHQLTPREVHAIIAFSTFFVILFLCYIIADMMWDLCVLWFLSRRQRRSQRSCRGRYGPGLVNSDDIELAGLETDGEEDAPPSYRMSMMISQRPPLYESIRAEILPPPYSLR